jgi:hypothetical protein
MHMVDNDDVEGGALALEPLLLLAGAGCNL